jgi:hypothetical protein
MLSRNAEATGPSVGRFAGAGGVSAGGEKAIFRGGKTPLALGQLKTQQARFSSFCCASFRDDRKPTAQRQIENTE